MDITRNWRLKSTRSQLLATRCPVTGDVRLPQQTVSRTVEAEPYVFDTNHRPAAEVEGAAEYLKAAR